MIYLTTFLYYTCFASAVMIYGLGLAHTTQINYFDNKNITFFIKVILSIFISAVLSWLVTNFLLRPIHLIELYPLISFMIFICINTFLEALIRITARKSTAEFIFSYLVILLSISESTSLLNTIVISGSCLLSLALLIPFIYAFRKRIYADDNQQDLYFCRFFLFIAVLIFIITVSDILWLNPGVIK